MIGETIPRRRGGGCPIGDFLQDAIPDVVVDDNQEDPAVSDRAAIQAAMSTVRQASSQRDTPMLSGRTLHDRSRVSDGWTKTVTPRVTARGRGVGHNRALARDGAWRRGVAHNRDLAWWNANCEISILRLYCPLLNSNVPLLARFWASTGG